MDDRRGFRRDFGPREMHDATCSECGATTKVPFKPIEGRPVYCRDCYQKHKPQRDNRGGGFNRGPRREENSESSESFEE
mgnify:CR=1 FL=1